MDKVVECPPMELFTKDGISYIASVVGYPLYVDKSIEERRIIAFARAEVGCEDELPNIIDVDIEKV